MGRYHTNWLNMMYPRLRLASNLLREDGVIFISIDDNEVHNLRKVCDEVFGEENFVADVVWKHTQQSKNDEKHFSRQYNHNVVYAKSISNLDKFSFERTEEDNKNYSNPDDDAKGMWRSGDVRSPNFRQTLCYEIETPDGSTIQPPENGWRWSKETLLAKINTGEIKFKKDYSGIIRKIYLCDQDGRTPENLWQSEKYGTTRMATSVIKDLFEGKQVFDTPKPKELTCNMMKISTRELENDIILDFFSGSATTAHAVMQLNAEDGGKRKYICVQIPELTDEKKEAYKAGYKNICEIGKERIRRAGKKILEENPDKQIDIGFKVFKLDTSNLRLWDSSPIENNDMTLFEQRLNDMVDSIKHDRTAMDVIYEVILKMGVKLDTEVSYTEVNGKVAYVIGELELLICFDKEIISEDIEQMAKLEPKKIVCAEQSFKDDSSLSNAHYILKDKNIEMKLV